MWNVYGAYEAPSERSHVISDFIHQALATGQIKMMTNGEELRQVIYIDDVCHAFEQAIYNRNLEFVMFPVLNGSAFVMLLI